MRKIICALLAMLLLLTACQPKAPEQQGNEQGQEQQTNGDDAGYKIGIMTGTLTGGEEAFRAAEKMINKYPDIVMHSTYPDKFTEETETLISNTLALADAGCKAIVFVQGVAGTTAAIDKVREKYPDIFFLVGTMAEVPEVLAQKADIIMNADEEAMGEAMMMQAKAMGAKTYIHYSFPRHMSIELIVKRRENLMAAAEREGIVFVDATAPDPTSEAGLAGTQQFMLEDVPKKIAQYGKETAIFGTNCGMQEPLIKSILQEGAIYPQQCCPSPYHGYPGALGIEIPEDKKGDLDYALEQITQKIAEGGGTGRFSTWPVPVNMLFIEAGVEYAKAFLDGETDGRNDSDKLLQICDEVLGQPGMATFRTYDLNGTALPNFYLLLSDFINF